MFRMLAQRLRPNRLLAESRPDVGRFERVGLYAAGLSLLAILLASIVLAWATADDVADAMQESATSGAPLAATTPSPDPVAAPAAATPIRPVPRPARG